MTQLSGVSRLIFSHDLVIPMQFEIVHKSLEIRFSENYLEGNQSPKSNLRHQLMGTGCTPCKFTLDAHGARSITPSFGQFKPPIMELKSTFLITKLLIIMHHWNLSDSLWRCKLIQSQLILRVIVIGNNNVYIYPTRLVQINVWDETHTLGIHGLVLNGTLVSTLTVIAWSAITMNSDDKTVLDRLCDLKDQLLISYISFCEARIIVISLTRPINL